MENTEEKAPVAAKNPEEDKDEEEILEKMKGDAVFHFLCLIYGILIAVFLDR